VVFFFQAEDGIRDKLVTGVQTCALPISFPLRAPDESAKSPHAQRINQRMEAKVGFEPTFTALQTVASFPSATSPSAGAVWRHERSEERRVGKECGSGWSRQH